MNDLVVVSDFGVTCLKDVPVVSSRKVADVFDKQHAHVMRDIQDIIKDLSRIGEKDWENNFIESTYKDSYKRKQPEFLLTHDGFVLLTMGFSGKKALRFKIAYINEFNKMESFIESRNIARMESRDLTDAIQALHDPPKHYHYSSEFDMINRIVLGMTSKQFRLQHGLSKETPIRDYLTLQQIDEIKRLQSFDAHLANVITDYKQRQKLLQEYYGKIYTRNTELTGT